MEILAVVLILGALVCGVSAMFSFLQNRRRSEYLDLISHQILRLLGNIRLASHTLSEGEGQTLSLKGRETLAHLHDAATQLLSLAENVFQLSRIDLGVFQSIRSPCDLPKELERTVGIVRGAAHARGLALTSTFDADAPRRVRIDHVIFRTVLFNLLENAIAYTERGSVNVACGAHEDHLRVTVTDTGRGLTREEQRHLFKKFFRGRSAQQERPGAGIGLYLARRLLSIAGGTITGESRGNGRGSLFTFELPFELDTEPLMGVGL